MQQRHEVTRARDVAEAVWRAANDPLCPLRIVCWRRRRGVGRVTLTLKAQSCDSGIDIRSNGDDDFAELAAVLEIPVHFRHLVELECAIDDCLERATREALGDVLYRSLPPFRVACRQSDAVSLDRGHLPDH